MTNRTIGSYPDPSGGIPDLGLHHADDELGHAMWTRQGTGGAPDGSEVRGFALYVGLREGAAAAAGWDLVDLVNALKAELRRLVPDAESNAILAVSPVGIGGRDLDLVRLALQEPIAVATVRDRRASTSHKVRAGVLIDMSRNRVTIDGTLTPLTFSEIELLQALVRRQGRAMSRRELIRQLTAGADASEAPTDRAVDVQIRRLRLKLGPYQDIIGTVRGAGYRFEPRGVATVLNSSTPSPDVV